MESSRCGLERTGLSVSMGPESIGGIEGFERVFRDGPERQREKLAHQIHDHRHCPNLGAEIDVSPSRDRTICNRSLTAFTGGCVNVWIRP